MSTYPTKSKKCSKIILLAKRLKDKIAKKKAKEKVKEKERLKKQKLWERAIGRFSKNIKMVEKMKTRKVLTLFDFFILIEILKLFKTLLQWN